jgi:hypothetical protein
MEGEGRGNSESWCFYTTARRQQSSSSMGSFGLARTEFKSGVSRVCLAGDEDGGVAPRYGTSRPIMASPDMARPRGYLDASRGGDRDGRAIPLSEPDDLWRHWQCAPCGQVSAQQAPCPARPRGTDTASGSCRVGGPRLDCRCDPSSHHAPNSPGNGARNMAHDTHLPISPHLAAMQLSLSPCVPGLDQWTWRRFGSAASECWGSGAGLDGRCDEGDPWRESFPGRARCFLA